MPALTSPSGVDGGGGRSPLWGEEVTQPCLSCRYKYKQGQDQKIYIGRGCNMAN